MHKHGVALAAVAEGFVGIGRCRPGDGVGQLILGGFGAAFLATFFRQ